MDKNFYAIITPDPNDEEDRDYKVKIVYRTEKEMMEAMVVD